MVDYYIQDKASELNKRIDDAFTELDTQRNRMSGLTKENAELKNELMRLQEVQKLKSLILRTILGVMSFLWIVQIIFNPINETYSAENNPDRLRRYLHP